MDTTNWNLEDNTQSYGLVIFYKKTSCSKIRNLAVDAWGRDESWGVKIRKVEDLVDSLKSELHRIK